MYGLNSLWLKLSDCHNTFRPDRHCHIIKNSLLQCLTYYCIAEFCQPKNFVGNIQAAVCIADVHMLVGLLTNIRPAFFVSDQVKPTPIMMTDSYCGEAMPRFDSFIYKISGERLTQKQENLYKNLITHSELSIDSDYEALDCVQDVTERYVSIHVCRLYLTSL